MKYFILLCCLLSFAASVSAQDFFVPKEIRSAVENGTRSNTGKPGNSYWQNSADYDINVRVDSYTKILSASARIKYYNNSPSSLNMLAFRIYQDFSRPGKSRDWEVNEKNLSDGMLISSLAVDNNPVALNSKNVSRSGTNLTVKLSTPLLSGSFAVIDVEWSFKILKDFPRMGMYDSTSFMIGYWYPQVSVFDDIDGWDMVDYKGQVEFYNDFNNFSVKITTDRKNMCVWATGNLKNPEQIFTENYISNYKEAILGNSEFIADCSNPDIKPVSLNNGNVTWHFEAESVPDFAFALSDHYIWKMKGIKLSNGKVVNLNTAFRGNAQAYNKFDVFGVAEKYLIYASDVFPCVPYPYPSMTVFNGDGGMEFPMMVNDDDTESWESTVYLTSHEMAHTYFPFFMGVNERKYAWMDEGWAVYLPQNFQTLMNDNPPFDLKDTNREDSRAYNVKSYLRSAGTFYDIPMLSVSHQLRSPAYRLNAYNKAALVYDIMKDMVGEKSFTAFMKEYIKTWNGKHPTPYDFFNLFNSFTGTNYNWFFEKWFMQFGIPDLEISSCYDIGNNEYEITVSNKGGMPVPVALTITDISGNEFGIGKDASAWEKTNVLKFKQKLNSGIKKAELGNTYIPDLFPQYNVLNLE